MSKNNLDNLSLSRPTTRDVAAEKVLATLPAGVAPSTITSEPKGRRSKSLAGMLPDRSEEVALERLAVDIPADLHAAIKMYAAQRKSTIRDDVAQILRMAYADVMAGKA
jgi:hypothetical protein